MLKFFKKYIEDTKVKMNCKEDKDKKIMIAVSALLLELAYCDDEFSEAEKRQIINSLKKKFNLNEQEAEELIEIAEKERSNQIDLWHFTNLINENYPLEDKIALIEMLWEIVYADNVLDQHEDYLIHILSKLLKLDHEHLIGAKLKAKTK